MSPRSTTRPLYFWYFGSISAFLRWQMSINVAKWTFLLLFLCLTENIFLALRLIHMLRRDLLELLPFFIHRGFRIQNFHRLGHWNKFMHQIVVSHWIESFLLDVIVMITSRKSGLQTLPCGFVSFHCTSVLGFLVWVNVSTRYSFLWFPCTLSCLHLSRHGRFHQNFKLLSCVLNGLFILSIFVIDKIDASQSSSIVKLCCSMAHSCFSFFLAAFDMPIHNSGHR